MFLYCIWTDCFFDCLRRNTISPLHTAINMRCWGIVDLLLQHGADVDGRGFWFQTPLHVACRTHNLDLVKVLIDQYHADKCLQDDRGYYHIHAACILGSNVFLNDMFNAGYFTKEDLVLTDYHGNTPLHIAADNDKSSLIADLVRHGASVHVKNDKGQTPYDVAKPFAKLSLEQIMQQQ